MKFRSSPDHNKFLLRHPKRMLHTEEKGRIGFTMTALRFLAFLSILTCLSSSAVSEVFEVGPSKTYENICNAPLDSMAPGDILRIFYREKPYREKFILRRSGTEDLPIIIEGVPEKGKLPIIEGSAATQTQRENSKESSRWLIKVGDGTPGDYVQIRNLELRLANNVNRYLYAGQAFLYEDNAAGIFIRLGKNVSIFNCIISRCGNGIQTTYGPNVDGTTVSGCLIYDNGNFRDTDSSQEHNVYLCGSNTTVQFCRFGEVHSDGNNIKDRGKNTVIRYNWIEGGKNRQIDLVEHKEYEHSDAYVYGNVIVQGIEVNNNNLIHYGGEQSSRSGTLYLFNNTIVATQQQSRFLVIRFSDCQVEAKNNVFVGKGTLAQGPGILTGSNNWFSNDIFVQNLSLGIKGANPGFITTGLSKYTPAPDSPLINNGTNSIPRAVDYMPKQTTGGFPRPKNGTMDVGAFEAAWVGGGA